MNKKQHFPDHNWSGIKKLLIVMKLTSFFFVSFGDGLSCRNLWTGNQV